MIEIRDKAYTSMSQWWFVMVIITSVATNFPQVDSIIYGMLLVTLMFYLGTKYIIAIHERAKEEEQERTNKIYTEICHEIWPTFSERYLLDSLKKSKSLVLPKDTETAKRWASLHILDYYSPEEGHITSEDLDKMVTRLAYLSSRHFPNFDGTLATRNIFNSTTEKKIDGSEDNLRVIELNLHGELTEIKLI